MDLRPGDVFDRYTIEAVLGEGGMGRVYQAYDARLDRHVALKLLLPEPSGPAVSEPSSPRAPSSTGPARLLREARAAAAFDHPNAVSIFDVGEVDGIAYIAMELVPGASLRIYAGDADVPFARKLRWLIEVARALEAAHARGLIHRDVKPENVMVRDDGVVKVLDFGIARRLTFEIDPTAPTQRGPTSVSGASKKASAPSPSPLDVATLTQRGTLIGTPVYMAPEQVRGDPVDARVDQYAWGVTAYEVLTGRLPFEVKRDAFQLVAEIFSREPPPLRDAIPGIPNIVEATILRALSKNPEKRFASMEKIVARLEPFAAESARKPPVPSEPPIAAPSVAARPETQEDARRTTQGMTPVANAPPRTSRAWLRIGLAAAVMTVAGGALLVGSARERASPSRVTVARAIDASADVPITALPTPKATREGALAAYRAGMQATRDASMDAAKRSFERATALEPTFAAALLRLGIATFDAAPGDARATFQRAAELRAALGDHDQVLLDAMEPYMQRQPSDFAEWERRLERAVLGAPRDADFLYLLGNARAHRGDLQAALDAYERAADVDPKFARARWAIGETQAYLGQLDAAKESLERCLDESPSATTCMQAKAWIAEEQRHCDEVEATAKRWIATDGTAPAGYDLLAKALFALGRPMDAVLAALAQKWSRTPEATRAGVEAVDRVSLAILAGRFDEAETRALELERAAAADPSLDAHARPALALVRIDEETGREADAARVADQFMKSRDAFVSDPREEDFALAKDATPEMNAALGRAGRLGEAELAGRRAAWLTEWKGLAPTYRHYLWIHGFAKTAETPDDAKAALAALADYEPLPAFRPLTFADGDIGRTYWLAGDKDAALPALERAASSCVGLDFPIAATRAQLFLGEVREAEGDKAGACSAYGTVLARWGVGAIRSRTARAAADRAASLGCPPR